MELLVVIAIILVLIALLLPLITRVRASAMNNVCKSNLRQIGMGIRMYTDDNKGFYPDPYTLGGAVCRRMIGERDPADPKSLPEKYGWPTLLQPYLRNRSENNVWRCPAVMNAIIDALWRAHRISNLDMPATPHRIWSVIKTAARSKSVESSVASS